MHFSVDSRTAQLVRNKGRYLRSGLISIRYLRDDGYRYSPVVSKRQGTSARRNRVKRVIREIMRAGAGTYPSGSYLIYYNGVCADMDRKGITADIADLVARLGGHRGA